MHPAEGRRPCVNPCRWREERTQCTYASRFVRGRNVPTSFRILSLPTKAHLLIHTVLHHQWRMRGADAFQHHLYYVLDDAHEPRCLQWDPQSRSQFVWHGDNHGLIEYLQVKRGRFGVSLEASFRKKLLLLGFVVCGHRSDCHPGHECVVYRYTDENAFFRGMHGELETPQAMTITPDAVYTHDIAVVERFLATFPWCSLDDEELEELTTYLAQEDPLVLSPLGDVPLTTLPPMSQCSSPEMQGIDADLGDLCF